MKASGICFICGEPKPHKKGKGSVIIGARPCPICDSKHMTYDRWHPTDPARVVCELCGAATAQQENTVAAVEAWNRGEICAAH